jgi:electron transport complex protein RnfG
MPWLLRQRLPGPPRENHRAEVTGGHLSMKAIKLTSMQKLLVLTLTAFAVVYLLDLLANEQSMASRQAYDRINLQQLFTDEAFDNDILTDSYLIPARQEETDLVNLDLLGLSRDRLAYRARRDGEIFAIAIPASADDGFNGTVDLLIAIDMYGRIAAARVLEDISSDALFGQLELIQSQWMTEFSGSSMRDILRISWSNIGSENEYDQFVGASITPKTVSNRIYDALVFFQSNRIALMQDG